MLEYKKIKFTPDMNEISGLGGDYEECCKRMTIAACKFLEETFPNNNKDNPIGKPSDKDDEAFSDAVVKAAGEYGPSGAQVSMARSHGAFIYYNGFEEYKKQKLHPEGELGILKDKLKEQKERADTWFEKAMKDSSEITMLKYIIAEKVLKWKKYKVDGTPQEVYAATPFEAETIICGDNLTKFIDQRLIELVPESVKDQFPEIINN